MKELSPDLVTFIVVPSSANKVFGSLFEIKSESDEIFVSGAKITDLEVIDEITATKIQASGLITTSTTDVNVGIQSSNLSVSSNSGSNNTGGSY